MCVLDRTFSITTQHLMHGTPLCGTFAYRMSNAPRQVHNVTTLGVLEWKFVYTKLDLAGPEAIRVSLCLYHVLPTIHGLE